MNSLRRRISEILGGRVDFEIIEVDINSILSNVSNNRDTSDKDDIESGQILTAEDVVNILRSDSECMRDLRYAL